MSVQPVTEGVAGEVFRAAAEGIDVPAPPVAAIVEQAVRERRRRRRIVGGTVAVALVVVGAGTWLGSRPDHGVRPTPPPGVVRVQNPADVAWWANGVLHLEHVTVKVPSVAQLVQVRDGAAVSTGNGVVVLFDRDGRGQVIGDMHPSGSLVGSSDRGWVVWVDPGGDSPQLIVYDVVTRDVIATRDLPGGLSSSALVAGGLPIAVDGTKVYYAARHGAFAWDPRTGEAPSRVDAGLADVGAATFVLNTGRGNIDIVQPFFSVDYERPGLGANVSRHGAYVLTHAPGRALPVPVRIYDTRSGERVWSGVGARERVDAATWGAEDEVVYAIARTTERPRRAERLQLPFGAIYELRTCHLEARTCTSTVEFPRTGTYPVLPD